MRCVLPDPQILLILSALMALAACGREPEQAAKEIVEPLPQRVEGLSEPRVNQLVVADKLLEAFATPGSPSPIASEALGNVTPASQASEAQKSQRPVSFEQAMALLDNRPPWQGNYAPKLFARHPAEKYLKGMVIVLDPGHGGKSLETAGYKTGPSGVREAEVNLRVCLLLDRLLTDAGATVLLTREDETSSVADDRLKDTLERRAAFANRAGPGSAGADLFLSIHHNVSSSPTSNYSTVWFHRDPDLQQVGLDAGRLIGNALGRHLKTQVAKTGVLMNDKQMYDTGFRVLRLAKVPALVCELSFYSNPIEEQRLRDAEYNLRAAYAIYEGLCEYAYGGRPTQPLPKAAITSDKKAVAVTTKLNDGLPDSWWGSDLPRVLESTLVVECNGQRVQTTYDTKTRRLTALIPNKSIKPKNKLTVRFQNLYKHSNWPQNYTMVKSGSDYKIKPAP